MLQLCTTEGRRPAWFPHEVSDRQASTIWCYPSAVRLPGLMDQSCSDGWRRWSGVGAIIDGPPTSLAFSCAIGRYDVSPAANLALPLSIFRSYLLRYTLLSLPRLSPKVRRVRERKGWSAGGGMNGSLRWAITILALATCQQLPIKAFS